MTFRESVGWTSWSELAHFFRNPLQSTREFCLPRSIERNFSWGANLSCINEESCYTAGLTSPSMDKMRTNHLLGLDRNIISITVAMLTGHCVMGRHTERMRLPLNDFCSGCRSAEKEETVIHFLCQCSSLARCRYRLFGTPTLVSLMELSSIDVKDVASFNKLSGWFSAWDNRALNVLALTNCIYLWRHNGPLCVLK